MSEPGKVKPNLSTPESREFWESCAKAAAEIAHWPKYKRAGFLSQNEPQKPLLVRWEGSRIAVEYAGRVLLFSASPRGLATALMCFTEFAVEVADDE